MRKGLLGPYEDGALSALDEMIRKAEELTGEKGCDIEGVFYATAFQAGVDHFVLHERPDSSSPRPLSEFLRQRTTTLDAKVSLKNWDEIRKAFSAYLPEKWYQDDKYSEVWKWNAFIAELLDAMAERSCMLSVGGIPDATAVEDLLPGELLLPIKHLAQAFQPVAAPSVVPSFAVAREHIDRYQQIVTSDLFEGYVKSEANLDEDAARVPSVISDLRNRGQALVRQNPRILSLQRASIGLLRFSPKLVDAVLGKLPGVLADIAAGLGTTYLEERRRVVVYDFRSIVFHGALSNLGRMIRNAESAESNKKQR